MKKRGFLIRHPEFSFLNDGRPTENGLSAFRKKVFGSIDPEQKSIVIATADSLTRTSVLRTKIPAEDLMSHLKKGQLIISHLFGPLTTKKYPSILNGRLYELLKNLKPINQWALTAWGAGLPLFKESPRQVNHRVKMGIRELQKLGDNSEQIIIIGHQELFPFFKMFFEGKTFAQALSQVVRRGVPYLETYYFHL